MPCRWIKIYDKLVDDWKFQEPNHLKLWLHLLLTANWDDGKPEPSLKKGQLYADLESLAKVISVRPSTVSRFLQRAQGSADVSLQRGPGGRAQGKTTRKSIITITSYEHYQQDHARQSASQFTRQSASQFTTQNESRGKGLDAPTLTDTPLPEVPIMQNTELRTKNGGDDLDVGVGRRLAAYFGQRFRELFGVNYIPRSTNPTAEVTAMAQVMSKVQDENRCKQYIDAFLEDPDPYLNEQGRRNIHIFKTRVGNYVQAANKHRLSVRDIHADDPLPEYAR